MGVKYIYTSEHIDLKMNILFYRVHARNKDDYEMNGEDIEDTAETENTE